MNKFKMTNVSALNNALDFSIKEKSDRALASLCRQLDQAMEDNPHEHGTTSYQMSSSRNRMRKRKKEKILALMGSRLCHALGFYIED